MGKEGRSRTLIPKPMARVIVQPMIINTGAKGEVSAVACWLGYSYSVLDLVGKKEYLHQHDGGCGGGGDDDKDVESKTLNAAFWYAHIFLNLSG